MERDNKEPIPADSGARDVDESDVSMDGNGRTTSSNPDQRPADEVNPASDDTGITDLDKTLADSFPASDPPAQP